MAQDAKTVERDLFNIQEGTKGRPDSIYLDTQERVQAEVIRALAEGREVETDVSKLPAAVGTTLVVKERQVDNALYSNPAMDGTLPARKVEPVGSAEFEIAPPESDVDLSYAAQVANERVAQDQALADSANSGDSAAVADSDLGSGAIAEPSTGDTSTGLSSEGGTESTSTSASGSTEDLTGFGPVV